MKPNTYRPPECESEKLFPACNMLESVSPTGESYVDETNYEGF